MRGESHLSISILMALPTWYMIYLLNTSTLYRNSLVFVLFGIAIGSLLPDLDASDAKVMHGIWRPIGLIGKYLFYRPLTRLLGTRSDLFADEHRGFLHSIFGCLLVSMFFALVTLILNVLTLIMFFWWLWVGIPIGFLLHLAEDSFTKSGVRWFFPRGEPTRSTTRLKRGSEYLLVVAFYMISLVLLVAAQILPSSFITILGIFSATIISFILLHRINPRISKFGDEAYLRLMVEEYVVKRGGVKVNSDASCIPQIKVEDEGFGPMDPYIAKITNVGGKYGLDRIFLKSSIIEAIKLKRGSVFEVKIYEKIGERRLYYVVKNELFCLFADRMI